MISLNGLEGKINRLYTNPKDGWGSLVYSIDLDYSVFPDQAAEGGRSVSQSRPINRKISQFGTREFIYRESSHRWYQSTATSSTSRRPPRIAKVISLTAFFLGVSLTINPGN